MGKEHQEVIQQKKTVQIMKMSTKICVHHYITADMKTLELRRAETSWYSFQIHLTCTEVKFVQTLW